MSISGPCLPSCTIQRNIFINYFVNASFLVALETFLRRREFHLIPFFKCKCFFLRGEIICWLFIFWYNQKITEYCVWEASIVLGVSLTFHRWGQFLYPVTQSILNGSLESVVHLLCLEHLNYFYSMFLVELCPKENHSLRIACNIFVAVGPVSQ